MPRSGSQPLLQLGLHTIAQRHVPAKQVEEFRFERLARELADMRSITAGSSMSAMMRMVVPQFGHVALQFISMAFE